MRYQQPHPSSDILSEVLESAARLQKIVPDDVLVGGSAAALYADHRASFDHDHVLTDLRDRFDSVLDSLEAMPDWQTNRAVPAKIILGQIGDIEAGVRQLRRERPLEVEECLLPSGAVVRVPTRDETLRIKAYLVVTRNQVRDYLDVAALAQSFSIDGCAHTLITIDAYYTDPSRDGTPLADQLVRQLAQPHPKDSRVITHLSTYKDLRPPFTHWEYICRVLSDLAHAMMDARPC